MVSGNRSTFCSGVDLNDIMSLLSIAHAEMASYIESTPKVGGGVPPAKEIYLKNKPGEILII